MQKSIIMQVHQKVKEIFDNTSKQSVSHRLDHAERVYKRAIKLAKLLNEKVDLEILKISALLHDIDEPYYEKKNHVTRSLKKATKILKNLNYPENKIQKVLKIIGEHSSEIIKHPTSIEAKILYDADKLDGIGAIGIARVFAFCGQQGLTPVQALEWYKQKIKKSLPLMQTEIAKDMAKREMEYVNSFFKKYENEEKSL